MTVFSTDECYSGVLGLAEPDQFFEGIIVTESKNPASSSTLSPSKTASSAVELSHNLNAAIASAFAAAKGTEAIGARAIAFAKTRAEAAVVLHEQLSKARSVSEALELHGAFAQEAVATWTAEMSSFSDLFLDASRQWARPLQERLSAAAAGVSL